MSSNFTKAVSVFTVQLFLLSVTLFGLHSYLFSYLGNSSLILLPLWQIYLFHTIIVFVFYTWILFSYSKGKNEIFNYFMTGTLIKMVLALLFLLPVFISELATKRPDVFNFFIPYFLFLAFEVVTITRLINRGKD